MNTDHTSPPAEKQYRRKIHYIDFVLQKRLLIALVALEVILLCIAGGVLYFRLQALVDENLYHIHFGDQPSIFYELFSESLLILGVLVAVNLVALLIADRIWAHYVNGIMSCLRSLLSRTRELDLRPDAAAPHRHKVLELALAWRETERARHLALRTLVERADSAAGVVPMPIEEYRAYLHAMREQLPHDADKRPTDPRG
ncbi:MAG TPA: hypothetical protein VGK14_13540 [Novimethylophilus sp.]|jgi:hypothetical protein|uniref:hypothetical protein n=1 Tax=Novimethylophilus sp. TaxID=2137426 RepID=UPI002F41F7A7